MKLMKLLKYNLHAESEELQTSIATLLVDLPEWQKKIASEVAELPASWLEVLRGWASDLAREPRGRGS